MTQTLIAWIAIASVLAGCGGSTEVSATSTGAGGGSGTTSTTSTTTVPVECVAPSQVAGPYAAVFRFTNSGIDTASVLPNGCGPVYSIFACADGYAAPLTTYVDCAPACPATEVCPQCGACSNDPVTVDVGKTADVDWAGTVLTTEHGGACTCVRSTLAAPAAKYRAKVTVHRGAGATEERTVDFELPAKDGVVMFDVGPKGL